MIEDTILSSIKFLEESKTSLVNLEIELDKYKENKKIDDIITNKEREITPIDLANVIKRFAQQHPNYMIVIDAPDSKPWTKCSDITFVYDDERNSIVLNAE